MKHLRASNGAQQPFAVRALLPCWVQIESWGRETRSLRAWRAAATTLRPLLSRASRWLESTSSSGQREERYLDEQEVQSLQAYFEREDLPELVRDELSPAQPYLPWLHEDAALAKQVADAWNAVVRRGEADVVRCKC